MFQEVSLKRNGWYSKLQKWTFGYVPFKNNFCPFFWLTIFCILVSPFIGSFKVMRWAAIKLFNLIGVVFMSFGTALNKMFDAVDTAICQPWYTQQLNTRANNMTDRDAYDLFDVIFDWWGGQIAETHNYRSSFWRFKEKKRKRYLDQWRIWKKKHNSDDEWTAKFEKYYKKQEELAQKRRQRDHAAVAKREEQKQKAAKSAELRAKRHKAMVVALAKYTKFLVFLPAGIVGIYLLYWIGLIVLWAMENWTSISNGFSTIGTFLLHFVIWAVGIILVAAVIATIVYILIKLIKKCALWLPPIPSPNMPKLVWLSKLVAPLRFVKNVALTVGGGVTSAVGFFKMYVKAFKENNCPAIEWCDDDSA